MSTSALTMNTWEAYALQYQYPDTEVNETQVTTWLPDSSATDPLIYPGLYAPSGFDMMSILVRVTQRPNPQIDLGAVDASCALVLCDLAEPDVPIVYASDAFCELTGYTSSEVIGRNCRMLQVPGGKVRQGSSRKYISKDILRTMRRAVEKCSEVQVQITNFKKNGVQFTNLLTMVPVQWDTQNYRYFVGFQCNLEDEQ